MTVTEMSSFFRRRRQQRDPFAMGMALPYERRACVFYDLAKAFTH